MFLPERYRRNPQRRTSPTPLSPEPNDDLPETEEFDEESESNAWDEADELAAMSDGEFYKSLRRDIDAVAAGELAGFREKPKLKDRPWGRRHKRRDRHGNAF